MKKTMTAIVAMGLGVLMTPAAQAQFAVIDVGAIAQAIEEVATMADQLTTMQSHLKQAQAEYQSITGNRGMQDLLSGTIRNYLPADWQSLQDAVNQTSSAYPALASAVQASLRQLSVLTPDQLERLSPLERERVVEGRQSVALLQATTQQALGTISQRFANIQQLITAIGSASDQKAILDLQARIQAEQGMLANDQTKLQSVYQSVQAQQWALDQQNREQAISDIGSLRTLPPMGL